jgi:hypothetical protein
MLGVLQSEVNVRTIHDLSVTFRHSFRIPEFWMLVGPLSLPVDYRQPRAAARTLTDFRSSLDIIFFSTPY